jgi:tetratricopeptide (TPR) repeat protein
MPTSIFTSPGPDVGELKKTLELDPQHAAAHFYLGGIYGRQGRYAEAIAEHRKGYEMTGGALVWAAGFMGCAHALAGDRHSAMKILRGFDEREAYVPPSTRAFVYLGLGEDEKAYGWLERAVEERDAMMPWIKVQPIFDRLHKDAQFQELLLRMKL